MTMIFWNASSSLFDWCFGVAFFIKADSESDEAIFRSRAIFHRILAVCIYNDPNADISVSLRHTNTSVRNRLTSPPKLLPRWKEKKSLEISLEIVLPVCRGFFNTTMPVFSPPVHQNSFLSIPYMKFLVPLHRQSSFFSETPIIKFSQVSKKTSILNAGLVQR